MKRTVLVPVLFAAICLSGCASPVLLPAGEYKTDLVTREDFINVYQDLIFLKIKRPEHVSNSPAYWNWAGRYIIDENDRIILEMDGSNGRKWHPHFAFLRRNDGILLRDLNKNQGYLFRKTPEKQSSSAGNY